jgi:hypothetical protein
MDDALLAMLGAEEARLEAELRLHPTYRRLEAVRASKRMLTEANAGPTSAKSFNTYITDDHEAAALSIPQRRTRQGSMSSKAIALAHTLFAETGRRYQSQALLRALVERGLEAPTGAKPQAALASIMSHHPEFDNTNDAHGTGYGLKIWSDPAPSASPASDRAMGAPTEVWSPGHPEPVRGSMGTQFDQNSQTAPSVKENAV